MSSSETRKTGGNKTIGELLGKLSQQIHALVQGEIDLAKAQIAAMVKKAGLGGALLAVAAVLSLYLLGLLLWLGIELFKLIVSPVLAILFVALLLVVVIIALAGVGGKMLQKAMANKPDPKTGMQKNVEAAKLGAKKGLNI